MTPLACICPQEIAAANHKIKTAAYWVDPEYQAIVAKRIEGETCHYCGQPPAKAEGYRKFERRSKP